MQKNQINQNNLKKLIRIYLYYYLVIFKVVAKLLMKHLKFTIKI